MTTLVGLNQRDVSVVIRMLNSDGFAAVDVSVGSPTTAGLELWYRREGENIVTEISGINDLSSLTSNHTDYGIKHIKEGYYRVDFPDAAFIYGTTGVLCGLSATDLSCVSEYVTIDPLVKFNGQPDSVTSTTITFASPGPNVYKGDYIYVIDGTGALQTRLVQSVSGLEVTHAAWDVNISATTSTIIIVPGDETIATGAINSDVATSSRSSHTISAVAAALDSSLAQAGLDKLLANAATGADVINNSIIAQLVSAASGAADWDTYNNVTDSLESIASNAATSAEITALNDITAADVWAELLGDSGYSASAIVQIMAGAIAGKVSGAGTGTITIRSIEDDANIIVATVDASGNRTAVSITTPGD